MTASVLPGIHEGHSLESTQYERPPPPRPYHHHALFKDNLALYQHHPSVAEEEQAIASSSPAPPTIASASADTTDDDVFITLDSCHDNHSQPGSPAKKRVKHVSQVWADDDSQEKETPTPVGVLLPWQLDHVTVSVGLNSY